MAVAANPVLHSKFKHVELDLFFLHEKANNGSIIVGEVPACDQVADIFYRTIVDCFLLCFLAVFTSLES